MKNGSTVRILHILKGMNRGGIETWLMHVLRNIDRDRYKFDFLTSTTEKCAYDDELLEMGCRIIPCLTPHTPLQYAKNFKRMTKENGPYDVLHSHMHHFSGFVCWLGQQDGIPMRIAHSHNDTKPKEAGAGLRRKTYLRAMELLIRRCATHGLACSELAAEDLFGEKWADVERWQLLYYGIDLIPFEERISKADVRQEFGFPHSAIILGHVGRFAEQKNHAFLIDIIAAAVNNEPRCRALLVGDGPLRPAIQDKVHKLGLEKHIVFAGVRPDIPRLMKGAMDVFVFPSLHEGLPVTLIEAQAAGLPCITSTQVTRQAAIVEGSVQYTSLAKSPDFWARAAVMMDKSQPSSSPEDALTNIAKTPFTIDYSVQCLCKCYDISKFKRPSAS